MPSSNPDLAGLIRDWLSGIMDFGLAYLYYDIANLLKRDPQRPSREQIKQAAFYLVRDNYADFLVGEKTIKDLDKVAKHAAGRSQ